METKAYVLKELKSGRYRCHNVYVSDEAYHKNIINASMYDTLEEAEYYKDSINRMCNEEFVKIVPVTITVEE